MPKPLERKRDFMEAYLLVKKSQIPKAGKGVFTTVDIEKDHIITEFSGEKVSHTIGTARFIMKQSHSILYLNKKYSIDSLTDSKCIATFINDAKGINKIPYLRNNTLLVPTRGRLFVVAKRNIKKGEELLMSYGIKYWKAMKAYKIV